MHSSPSQDGAPFIASYAAWDFGLGSGLTPAPRLMHGQHYRLQARPSSWGPSRLARAAAPRASADAHTSALGSPARPPAERSAPRPADARCRPHRLRGPARGSIPPTTFTLQSVATSQNAHHNLCLPPPNSRFTLPACAANGPFALHARFARSPVLHGKRGAGLRTSQIYLAPALASGRGAKSGQRSHSRKQEEEANLVGPEHERASSNEGTGRKIGKCVIRTVMGPAGGVVSETWCGV